MIKKICKQCNAEFEITDDDLAFYKKISPTFDGKTFDIPAPTLCPECRYQRRISFRNERFLYKRKCDLSKKEIISMYSADVPFPVYHITEWFSDKWSAKDYGRSFDFSRPFFEQFKELSDQVPRFHAFVDPAQSENSEYTNQSINLKNCYLVAVATNDENCFYSRAINNSKDCCDCLRVNHCELCYECLNLTNCYHCFYADFSDNCRDCYLSTNLQGCRNCFGCHELNNKEFYIYNKEVSPEEWHDFIDNVDWSELTENFKKSEAIRLSVPRRFARLPKSENCIGDNLSESSDSHNCFDCSKIENCGYCNEITLGAKDSYDFSMTGQDSELVYEAMGCGYATNNSKFLINCRQNVYGLFYCDSCFPQVKNCFGCISLKNAECCILNKQYTKEEYDKLVPQIIEHMQKTGEWGEFFPADLSPFPYSTTLACDYFPMNKEVINISEMKLEESENAKFEGEALEAKDISEYEQSQDRVNELLGGVLVCKESGRPHKIVPAELSFYVKNHLPIPRLHPDKRYTLRFDRQNPRKLYHRKCMHEGCKNEFETTYSPDRLEKVYCEDCYQKAVL